MPEQRNSSRRSYRATILWAVVLGCGALRIGIGVERRRSAIETLSRDGWKIDTRRPIWYAKLSRNPSIAVVDHVVGLRLRAVESQAQRLPVSIDVVREFSELERFEVHGFAVTDVDLERLARLTQLEELELETSDSQAIDWGRLRNLGRLKSLLLTGPAVNDATLATVGELKNLELLALDGTRVTDEGLKSLTRLERLRDLSLSNTSVTESGVEHLVRALPLVRITDD